jgi:hypothetical protein
VGAITGRTDGYARLFAEHAIPIDANDASELVLFRNGCVRRRARDHAELTSRKTPQDVMCASSRMVVKRKGTAPVVVACTSFHTTGGSADRRLPMRQPIPAQPSLPRACVLGGGTCSSNCAKSNAVTSLAGSCSIIRGGMTIGGVRDASISPGAGNAAQLARQVCWCCRAEERSARTSRRVRGAA